MISELDFIKYVEKNFKHRFTEVFNSDQAKLVFEDMESKLSQANERLEKLVDLCDEACLDQIAGDDESTLKPLDDAKVFLKQLSETSEEK